MLTIEQKRALIDSFLDLKARLAGSDAKLMAQSGSERFIITMHSVIQKFMDSATPDEFFASLNEAEKCLITGGGTINMLHMTIECLRKEIEEELNAAPAPRI